MSLESIKKQVKEEIEKLSRVLHLLESGAKRNLAKTWGGRRRLSAAGRRRIAEAQKARWARVRAADKKAA
jgi:hypothetical protein